MYFLVRYDRVSSQLEALEEFGQSERDLAIERKEAWECECIERIGSVEVVLLEARTRDSLMESHRRYFKTREDLFSGSESMGRGDLQNVPGRS